MNNLTIRPINTGYIPTYPLQYHYHFSAASYLKNIPNEKVALPVFTFLIEGGDKLLLIDTGMCDTERANKYHHPGSWQDKGMAIDEQLQKIGYKPEDIDIVVCTHLHWDHISNMGKFKNATFIAHEREWEFAQNPIPLYYKSYESPVLGLTPPFAGINMKTVKGETEIMAGVRTFESFGHSPGHISVEIDTKDGKYICAGDSIFVLGNLKGIPELHYNITPPGRFYNIVESWKSIEMQKSRMLDESHLLLCHDKALEERVKTTPIFGG